MRKANVASVQNCYYLLLLHPIFLPLLSPPLLFSPQNINFWKHHRFSVFPFESLFWRSCCFFFRGDDAAKSIETAKTISFPAFQTWKTKVACHFERTIVYSSSSCLNIMTFFCKSAFISPLPATPLTSETSLRSWESRLLHPPMCTVSRS